MTGDISMTSGTATIAGFDIRTNLQEVSYLLTVQQYCTNKNGKPQSGLATLVHEQSLWFSQVGPQMPL